MSSIRWHCCSFAELGLETLYALLQLRAEVFVVEQECPYQDLDDSDQAALHVLGYLDDKLVAYARLLPPGVRYESCSIGRVVTSTDVRKHGHGRELMRNALAGCRERWPQHDITISAQHYLENFYTGLGFKTESEPYLEDNIPHVRMRLPMDSKE